MWWGLYLPVYLILFFVMEHLITDNYWATQTVIDDYIPFCEYFVIPYDSLGLPAVGRWACYLIVKDAEGFRRYMWIIMHRPITTATLFCCPGAQRPGPAPGGNGAPAEYLHLAPAERPGPPDTNANVFPSVHVLGVVAAICRHVAFAGTA